MKTYSDGDEFPSNIWFADDQTDDKVCPCVLVRHRDECATINLIEIPCRKNSLGKRQACVVAEALVEFLNMSGA